LILLLTITGGAEVAADDADVTVLSQRDVSGALLRTGSGPGSMELEALYTPTWYFEWSGRPEPATDGAPTLAFFYFETTHIEDLPEAMADVSVITSAGSFEPTAAEVVSNSPHHRVTQLMFPAESAAGEALVLQATFEDGSSATLEWPQPLPFGLGALNTADTDGRFTMPALSFGAIAAIFSGMLAALTPCILLLAAYFTAVLSGTAAASSEDRAGAERRLLLTGLFFVGGFTAVYTAGGVIAGFIGESVNRFENIGDYSRPVSVIAGIVVVVMGIRMASQARVPLVCKLPGFNRPTRSGWVGSAVMGSTFAVGCLSCFSATVLTALLLYAGATGSPLAGGLVMLMFSAGTGVMFLLAAVLVARAAPVTEWLSKAQPVIGTVSAIVMVALGVLMITYKFHLFTGYLFELWS
jgi:cytochrome c-type biogenesis protein